MDTWASFSLVCGLRVRLLTCAGVLCVACAAGLAQAPPAAGSDYTTALPSAQRIESEIKGTDPADTLARQIAVFEYLQFYVQNIKYARTVRGPYTPGEQKILADYAKAQNELTQSYTKTHTAAEVAEFNRTVGRYQLNNAYDWVHPLMGQQATDTYKGAEATLAQSYNRNQERIQNGLNHPQGAQGDSGTGYDFLAMFEPTDEDLASDPDLRRCLELGGTVKECRSGGMLALGKAASDSLLTLAGDTSQSAGPRNGVILVGQYHSRTELPEIALFVNGMAEVQKCGTLVDEDRWYTMRKSGATTQIVVANEPAPIVLTVRADGSLTGPGSVQVKGQIISGYHNEYRCTTGTPAANCTTTSTPIYAPSMQRCTIGQLAPQPPPVPGGGDSALKAELAKMVGADSRPPVYGLRVMGPYASSNGMKLEFDNHSVMVECGKAHVRATYEVENTAAGFVIHVQNGGGAFLLAVAPDNTLRGSGSTTVNGKLLTAVHGGEASFTPHSESCSVATLAPQGKQNTMVASNGPMPRLPVAYSAPGPEREGGAGSAGGGPSTASAAPGGSGAIANSLAGAGITSATSGARAQFRVLLSSSFSGTNPLAGQAVFVSRKPIDQILRELGVAVPAKATPAQAMKALETQCHSAQGCSAVMQGMPRYYVTTTKLDGTGKATLAATATTGEYYFFAIVPAAGGSLVWDVSANLQAGDNQVAFSQANAERVQ